MDEIQKSIIDAIKIQVNEKIKDLQFDKTCYGKVVAIRDDVCDVEINGEITQCKIRNGLQISINDIVLVRLINNDFSNKFVDAKLGTVGDDVEVEVNWSDIIGKPSSSPSDIDDSVSKKHTHNNLSLLETITQTLVNAWNSAVSHISDTIRHITSSERDLWNTVSNKVDNTEVVTTATPNKILKLDSNSKLPASITGNADGNASTATKLQTARNISLSGDVTGSASFDGSADASITTALSNTGVTAGTYTKVTVDTKGRVTAGSSLSTSDIPNLSWTKITSDKPTTLSGYGITDGVRNAGNTPSIQAGTDSSKPSAGTAGRIYIATDTSKIYRDTGSSWQVIGVVNWSDLSGKPSSSVANIDDAVNKRHTQNTDTTLTGSGANTINTTGTGNIVDFKVNGSTKSSIDNNGNFTGNAATASKLQTARTISLSGDVTGSANFDGSSNITINATVVDDSHNHVISNIDNLQTILDSKAPLASPAFTGIPTAPTAPNGTDTDQIATTKFVQNALSASGYGDMLKAVYDTNNDGKVDRAEIADNANSVAWGNVTGKPNVFPPSSHIHTISDIANLQSELDGINPPNGIPRSNLGNPTIEEMAIIDAEFTNKLWFYPHDKFLFEYTNDGNTWVIHNISENQIKRFVSGNSNASIAIPRGCKQYRITITNKNSYVYINALYMYYSTNGNSTQVQIWKKRNDSETWVQHTSSTINISGWPGHLYLPFSTIPWSLSSTSNHYHIVRIVFTPTWNDSNSNDITLYGMELWGGYPSGKRTIYTWDENQNVTFPAEVMATNFNGKLNGTRITVSTTAPSNPGFGDIWIDLN